MDEQTGRDSTHRANTWKFSWILKHIKGYHTLLYSRTLDDTRKWALEKIQG